MAELNERITQRRVQLLDEALSNPEVQDFIKTYQKQESWASQPRYKKMGIVMDGPSDGLFSLSILKPLGRMFNVTSDLIVRGKNGLENGWRMNPRDLSFYIEDRKVIFQVINPKGDLFDINIKVLELSCKEDDIETIARIRVAAYICGIISGDITISK
jgi:hypothetical protein